MEYKNFLGNTHLWGTRDTRKEKRQGHREKEREREVRVRYTILRILKDKMKPVFMIKEGNR